MPAWLYSFVAGKVLPFVGQRALHFIIYGVLALGAWGVYHKLFVQPTTSNIIDKQVNIYDNPSIPVFGCSAWRVHGSVYWEKARNKS